MLADVPNPDPEGAAPKAKPAADIERVPSVKRKDPPPATGTRFKAAANMVVAMRRFQGEWCVCVWVVGKARNFCVRAWGDALC